ncbi:MULTISPECIES: hypothetical protein [Symbiopectobacterium]|uniref:hypothetical protein n=1 Tax=Symbiopectobacterium TaxID=801 RepID=UPI00207B0C6B|nr:MULTISPECIES: hypothetical protein [Symbiopectobacterium]
MQFIRGSGEGERLRGEVDSTSYGVQLALTPTSKVKWSTNYNHIVSNPEAYLNGRW